MSAILKNNVNDVHLLLQEDGVQLNPEPLYWAAMNGHAEIVAMLLRQPKINVNQYCNESTPLHEASFNGHVPVVNLLLLNGADANPNIPDSGVQSNGTALHMATLDSHLDVIKLLILNGADVNITDTNQQTPLIWAINCLSTTTKRCECVRLLLQQQNIDVYIRDAFGCNAMYWAKHNQFPKIVQLLEKFTNFIETHR